MVGFLKKYINKRIELLKLELTETISGLVSILIFVFTILILSMMFLFLFSFAIGMIIGTFLNNYGIGILIFSFIYLIAFIVLLLNYSRIRQYIMRKIIEFQLNEKYDGQDEEE
ncbi:MAG: phage holin family protein [Flavobacteriaceae bacterium]|jgi:hypothetical protein|nr:phage holin family protein [Flavobacteriaceae bacterium]